MDGPNGIDDSVLASALYDAVMQGGKSTALQTDHINITYAELAEKIKSRYEDLKQEDVQRMAVYAHNSVNFCIDLLTALVYFECVFIFPTSWKLEKVKEICISNRIDLIISDEAEIWIDADKNKNPQDELKDVKAVLFTSGTVHNPKGVMLTGENLYTNAIAAIDCLKYTADDTLLVTKPLYHSYGLTIEFISGILAGAALYIYESMFSPGIVRKLFAEQNITVWCTIPTLLAFFINNMRQYCGNLRVIAVGGEKAGRPLLIRAKEVFGAVPVIQLYGLTEAGPLVTSSSFDAVNIESIGQPVLGVELELRDKEDNIISEPGISGELVISSKSIMKGYLGDIQKTNKVIRDGKLYTGDIAYFDSANNYYFVEREDMTISRHGINVYCSEIEESISEIEGVERVIVLGISHPVCSQIAAAFVKRTGDTDEKAIIQHCLDHEVAVPDKIIFIDNFPVNENGKVSLAALRKIYEDTP